MARCPIKKIDPDACVDFSTKGNLVTDSYRDGWELVFGNPTEAQVKEWKRRLKERLKRG